MKRKTKTATPPPPPPEPGAAKFRIASRILWVVGLLQVIAGGVFFVFAPNEADRLVADVLREKQVTIHEVKAIPPDKRTEFDQVHRSFTWILRRWHGYDVLAGVITFAGAFFLRRAPLAATICPLVLFFFLTAAKATFQPGMPLAMLFVRVLVLWTLIAALVAAIAARREQRAPAAA